jgi:hypothetical protein
MKAKLVSETLNEFHQTGDPLNKLNLGFGNHPKTKSFKILNFIGSKGEEGVSFTEIQHFILVTLGGMPEEEFWEKSDDCRKTRGSWCTNLYGSAYHSEGLLTTYCHKNTKGKWVLDKLPYAGENIYKKHKFQ